MTQKPLVIIVSYLLMLSCSSTSTVAGYYQGTYSSNDPAHPYGNVVVNISETNGGWGVNINFSADGYPNIQLNNIAVTTKNQYFITTFYFSYMQGGTTLYGSGNMTGNAIYLKYGYDVAQYHYILIIDADK